MVNPTKSYHEYLIESLKDPEEAAGYLTTAFEEGEPRYFLKALRNVAEAHGGLAKLAKETNLNRESLYRTLSEKGNPRLDSLHSVLKALGLHLVIEAETKAPGKAKKPKRRKVAMASA